MKPLSREHLQALSISAALTAVVLGGAAFFVDWKTVTSLFPAAQQPATSVNDQLNIGEALAYVKTLPAYNPAMEDNLHFDKITPANNGVSIIEFIGSTPTRYLVFWQNGRVIGHEIQTSDETHTVTIIDPEPEEILSRTTLPVRGVTKPNQRLLVKLLMGARNATILSREVTADESGKFNIALTVPGLRSGEYLLSVAAGKAVVTLPIVFDIRP